MSIDVYDIIDIVYNIINVPAVTGLINGSIYGGELDDTALAAKLRDISIIPLPISASASVENKFVPITSTGVISVNCHAEDNNGVADKVNLQPTAKAVIAELEAYSAENTFKPKFESNNIIPDNDRPGMSYANIRINYNIIE